MWVLVDGSFSYLFICWELVLMILIQQYGIGGLILDFDAIVDYPFGKLWFKNKLLDMKKCFFFFFVIYKTFAG